ncbi:Mpo1-like protein [Paenibacillus caseinilyticus]|nr:Mpo1-like protein [Paenibacillus caseinilyticus]MCZ8520697.1 DUF962 domain-containing protein [Paenibacillus caseinilyticus]
MAAAHYVLSWTGHFGFEKNRPASFHYPLLGFYAGFAWFFVRTFELAAGRRVITEWEREAEEQSLLFQKEEGRNER